VFGEAYVLRYMTPAELIAAKAAAAVESDGDLLIAVMDLIPGPWSGPGSITRDDWIDTKHRWIAAPLMLSIGTDYRQPSCSHRPLRRGIGTSPVAEQRLLRLVVQEPVVAESAQ
jgi:hypothetical protein